MLEKEEDERDGLISFAKVGKAAFLTFTNEIDFKN